jgi:hypothetical protein
VQWALQSCDMPVMRNATPRGMWTPEEIAREQTSTHMRAERDRIKSPQERLEETVRLSRLVSELRQGLPGDVRAG